MGVSKFSDLLHYSIYCYLAHVENEAIFAENLEKLGSAVLSNSNQSEPDIGSAFLKLAAFAKSLSIHMKTLVSI